MGTMYGYGICNVFSSPYGDGTMDFYYWGIVNLFLPPYGDCTEKVGFLCW